MCIIIISGTDEYQEQSIPPTLIAYMYRHLANELAVDLPFHRERRWRDFLGGLAPRSGRRQLLVKQSMLNSVRYVVESGLHHTRTSHCCQSYASNAVQ